MFDPKYIGYFLRYPLKQKPRPEPRLSHTVDQKVKEAPWGWPPHHASFHQDLGCVSRLRPPLPSPASCTSLFPSPSLSPRLGGWPFPTPGCLIWPLSCRPFHSPAQNSPAVCRVAGSLGLTPPPPPTIPSSSSLRPSPGIRSQSQTLP